MPTLADKISFAEKHVSTKEGVKWSLTGREWVRDQFWLPADGWKLWKPKDKDVCSDCADRIGELIEHPVNNDTASCECGGLVSEPILVTILNLSRGDGKTFNLAGYSLATLAKGRNKSIACLWASEDQGTQIFEETWNEAIKQDSAMRKKFEVFGTPPQIWVPSTRSRLEVLSASHRSLTGRRRTHVLIDEGRDIEARTVTALLPSVNAMHGIECPSGHVQLTPEEVESMGSIPEKCTACGQLLTEWWPRIIIVSASGTLSGTEKDWLYELVEELEANPHPNYHLFTSAKYGGKSLNPRKSAKVTSALSDVFGKLPSMKHYLDAEQGNVWTRKGEDVLTTADIKRVMDASLQNEEGTTARAVGFLDTSTTVEKTSLVILAEDKGTSETPWGNVYVSFLEFWWPGRKGVKVVDGNAVKAVVESIVPLYPNLEELHIDVRAGAKKDPEYLWPTIMLREIRAGQGQWRRKLKVWTGASDGSNDDGWDLFIERVLGETIRLPYSQEILEEVKGISMQRRGDSRARVVDRNRRIMHRDITQSIACCCYLAKRFAERQRRRGTMAEMIKRTSSARVSTSRPSSIVFGKIGPNSF